MTLRFRDALVEGCPVDRSVTAAGPVISSSRATVVPFRTLCSVTVSACLSRLVQIPASGSVTLPSQGATSVNSAARPAPAAACTASSVRPPFPNQSSEGNASIGLESIYNYFSNHPEPSGGGGSHPGDLDRHSPPTLLSYDPDRELHGGGGRIPLAVGRKDESVGHPRCPHSEKGAPWTSWSFLPFRFVRHHAQ